MDGNSVTMTRGMVFTCPVDGCEFTHEPKPLVQAPTAALDAIFGMPGGAFQRQAQHQWQQQIERDLATHLDTHTSVEWLSTVVGLRNRLGLEPSARSD